MGTWLTPVTDRTINDVLVAKDTINRWITSNPTIFTELKGCLNVTDINRIEGNIQYLSDLLNSYQYANSVETKEWSSSGLPTVADFQRIIANIKAIFVAYLQPPSAEELPDNMTYYDEINRLEQNLGAIKELLDQMEAIFPICGVLISGSRTLLPLRR